MDDAQNARKGEKNTWISSYAKLASPITPSPRQRTSAWTTGQGRCSLLQINPVPTGETSYYTYVEQLSLSWLAA